MHGIAWHDQPTLIRNIERGTDVLQCVLRSPGAEDESGGNSEDSRQEDPTPKNEALREVEVALQEKL